MIEFVGRIAAIAFLILALTLTVWLYILLPAGMAERRNRSATIWVLISFVGSPLLAILLLMALGENRE